MREMRKLFLLLVVSVFFHGLDAQVLQPATWEYDVSETEVKVGDEIELIFKATIDAKWYLYSSDFDRDLGPMLTEFEFTPDTGYELVGEIMPINPSKKYDEIWEGEVSYFKGTGEFRQKVKITGENPVIRGDYSYQVCSDIDGKCIPFDDDFTFKIKTVAGGGDLGIATQTLQLPGASQSDGDGILKPAAWNFSQSNTAPKAGDEVELVFKANIDDNWVLYSSDVDLVPGPIPATFTFSEDESYELIGEIQPIDAHKKYDKIFEGDVTYFKDTAEFRQKVKILKQDFDIAGTVEYQVCSDIDGKCIPFEEDFSFGKGGNSKGLKKKVYETGVNLEDKTLIAFMIFAFLSGIIALLTPCVFPMIPMTVSFFLKESENSKRGALKSSLVFGGSIVFLFTVIGTLVALIFGADALNQMATHWLPNIFIFIIFFIFALSFLGMFEITLPSAFVNKIDQKADQGGYGGIFFMASTLALVSFSCTFPIVGSVLVLSSQGEFIKPILGMLSFSLAFGLPFAIFAAFPELLKNLPKSGGWLNTVKVFLGFLELGLGLKFLSVADQAYHWGILDREVYLAFWIVIFSFLGFYLLGKIRLPHDSPLEVVSVPRLILSVLVFTFVVFLIPGMFGAPLKALAGYLPPMSTHDFNLNEAKNNHIYEGQGDEENLCDQPKYSDFLHFPHGIKGYFDYEQALSCAKERNKPVFIDFTGHGCVNCREMEARVWSDPAVLQRFNNDFVMLALYVDDKTELPESEWHTSDYDNKVKKTIGKQNADLQIRKYNNNAQPFYLIVNSEGELMVDSEGKVLVPPKSYDLNISNFIDFLDSGKKAFAESR
jgi:thiol:disulfide interchange protein DsbD